MRLIGESSIGPVHCENRQPRELLALVRCDGRGPNEGNRIHAGITSGSQLAVLPLRETILWRALASFRLK